MSMDVRVGDTLTMKKTHPCGSKQWLVLRTGMDFRLRCLGCPGLLGYPLRMSYFGGTRGSHWRRVRH